MTINLDQYTPPYLQNILIPVSATVSSPIIECSNGSVYSNDMCVPCPLGTKYVVLTKTCDNCPLNTYQSLTGQSSCTPCVGVKNYTMAVRSNSSSDCVSECVKTPNYCNTGTCTEDQFSVNCTCPAGLQGDRCQSRAICGKGFQFNHTSNECNGCKLGYYKDVVGNSFNCTACPVNKTTSYENSTSVNNCNIDDCLPGYRRAAPTGCQICEKGYYQSMNSQESCITCGFKRTTETTGSTNAKQCINVCPDGQQHNFYNDTCTKCDKGFYTDRQKTEKCIKCPNGQTTVYPGANQCIINIITTVAPPASVTVPVKFVFTGRFDCSSSGDLENFRIQILNQIILRLKFLAVRYQGLCSNACQNINSLVIIIPIGGCKPKATQGKRRREVADNELQFDVQIPGVSSTLTNAYETLTTLSVLLEDMAVYLDQYTPPALQNILSPVSATVSSPIIECSNGSVYSNDMCVPCPAGTRYLVSIYGIKTCDTCPLNTYQSLTGQSSCTPCVDVKNYTMAVGSNSSSDCVSECVKTPNYCNTGTCTEDQFSVNCICPAGLQGDRCQSRAICGKGFQFNHTSNECNGCKLGYYKDVVGNSFNCTACPVNKTTSYENSTSVNNCNIDDCLPGYRRAAPSGCQICEKGYYQPMNSQESCITCGINRTTETTGSTKLIQCINACRDGQQHNFYNNTCTNCDKGFYTDRQKTEKCIKCPNGQTTVYPGAYQCIKNTVPTVAPPASVTVPVKFVFSGLFDCSSLKELENFRTHVKDQIILRMTILADKYQGLCSKYCQNIKSLVISTPIGGCKPKATQGKRRRDVANNELQIDVQIPGVSYTLTTDNADVTLAPLSVIQEEMAFNLDQYTPQDLQNILIPVSATVSSPIIECSDGSVYNNDVCVPCPAGTRYVVLTKTCDDCTLNTYQNLTGQSSCTPCADVKKYTMAVGSKSFSDCVSECVKTPNYCNTGTCTEDQFSVYCTCPAGLQGDRCQSRDQPQSSNPAIIGGTVGGGVGLLILILVIILICKKFRGRGTSDREGFRKKFNKINETDSDVPYRNPVYDNYAFQRPLPLAYNREWQSEYGHDPYNPYINQGYTRGFEPDNEAVYYPSGTPRGHHEWRPA